MKLAFRKPRAIAPAVQLPHSNPDAHGHPQNCLNCGAALLGAYCHDCGQSAHTHRMSFKHFLLHDFVHGVWHLDKGFPATIKKAFVNPGKEIRAYLAGKRAGWFSILTTIVLILAVTGFLDAQQPEVPFETEDTQQIVDFMDAHAKWILLGSSLLFSLSSVVCFRRLRLNLSEHTIINAFFLVGVLVINLVDTLFGFIIEDTGFVWMLVVAIYLTYAYHNAFRQAFSFGGWLWRYVAHVLLSTVIVAVIGLGSLLAYLAITGKDKLSIDTSRPPAQHAPATTH